MSRTSILYFVFYLRKNKIFARVKMASSSSSLQKDVALSKQLSWLLRHSAPAENLAMRQDGYARVDDILARNDLKRFTRDDVRRVVEQSDKQRYQLQEDDDGTLWIRASQGHSIKNLDLQLKAINLNNADSYPVVEHGTYRKAWESIKTQGLSKCSRNHIHFSKGKGSISGARSDCTVLIRIDLKRALKDGYEFYESANGVILCAGNKDGFLPARYFANVTDAVSNESLL